jgi:formylglycine-generating enzyme required for sulfatase activity
MASWFRGLCILFVGLLVAGACSDSGASRVALAGGCAINSECNQPLVCAFRTCHDACKSSRDCPDSERCVASDRPFSVCQLPSERDCSYNSQCGTGQVCGVDGQCRDQCSTTRDCVAGQLCVSGTCADPTDLSDGKLPVKSSGDGGVAPTGQPCSYSSECPAPLRCRSGLCAPECLMSVDCPSGARCVDQVCVATPAEGGGTRDAGAGAGCVYNSDCMVPLACKGGVCRYECVADVDCSRGDRCVKGVCVTPGVSVGGGPDAGCIPSTCLQRSKNCGVTDDGCGGAVACGACPAGQTCGGGGIPNVCGKGDCAAKSCQAQGKNCGTVSDGCSLLVDCGTCTSPSSCGGGGQDNVCGCITKEKSCDGKCGTVIDACGVAVTCGGCTAPETCGGAGTANECGCTQTTCAAASAACGFVADGCGGLLDCGGCTTGACGGSGTPNTCGAGKCAPSTCATLGDDCGSVSDGCADKLDCGKCKSPEICGGGAKPNVCACPKTTCAAESKNCGSIPDGCGGSLDCGKCNDPATCGGAGMPNVCGCVATTCDAQKKNCGVISDGCGGLLDCGGCPSPDVCGGSGVPNICAKAERPPSCLGGGTGAGNTCGTSNDDCCASNAVPAGSFNRDGNPTYPATVSAFRLDRYLVSVGRMRAFLNAGQGIRTNPPAPWSGGFPKIPNSGWNPDSNSALLATTADLSAALRCDSYPSWTPDPAQSDNNPITCVNWYEAMAFCAWDNGWLPTEVQLNYAQEGGNEQRYFPWSVPAGSTTIDITYANFVDLPGRPAYVTPVGAKSPKGDGKWGQTDLVGNVFQLAMDVWNSPYTLTTCADCAYLGNLTTARVLRGGSWNQGTVNNAARSYQDATTRWDQAGFRCAHLP